MLSVLKDQEYRRLIPAGVRVAHKTGVISGIQHDSGIVYLPGGQRYVLVILCNGLDDEEAAADVIACVSQFIYNFVKDEKRSSSSY